MQKITETYGKCCNPYKDGQSDDLVLAKLKKEINGLCERIALEQKQENEKLKQRILQLENENKSLLLLCKSDEQKLKQYFKEEIKQSI